MKKIFSFVVCFLLVTMISLSFVACGGSKGKYKFYGVKIGDSEVKSSDLTDVQKVIYQTELYEGDYIKLSGNSTFVKSDITQNKNNDSYKTEIIYSGCYEVYGEKLILDFSPKGESNSFEYIIRDGKIFVPTIDAEIFYIYKK